MEIWASVDPKNINEEPEVLVLLNDWCRDLDGLIIRYSFVLFLDCFSF